MSLVFFIISFICLTGCVRVDKGNYEKQHTIKLKDLGDVKRLTVYNDFAILSFKSLDVLNLINSSNKEGYSELLKYLETYDDPTIQISKNNLETKSDFQEALFPIIRKLLFNGDVEVIDLERDQEIDEIVIVSLTGLGGEQEVFKFKNGKVFYTQVISF